jgi:hypothetical protein
MLFGVATDLGLKKQAATQQVAALPCARDRALSSAFSAFFNSAFVSLLVTLEMLLPLFGAGGFRGIAAAVQ